MFRKPLSRWASMLATALALVACGGGGGSDGGIDGTGGGGTGGIDGTGMSYGTITAFGSVWVNGVRFDTSGVKTIKLDDNPVGQDDLRVGMVIRLEGAFSATPGQGTANVITVDDAVKGRVEAVNATGIVVMGQNVVYDNRTNFDNGVRPSVGQYVEVHGLSTGPGSIAAGYVQVKTTLANPPYVVKGVVSNHNTATSTFNVGTLTVTYVGATTGDMPAGSWNGLLVDAKGSTCAGNPVCGTLTASKVEPGGPRVANNVSLAKAEVEGFVASGTSASFVINGQQVVTTGSTVFEGGLPSELVVGAKVEAEGPLANGVITATKVSFRDNIRLEANVASVAGDGSITLVGLPGVTVQTSALTQFRNVANAAALRAGDHLRIKARPNVSATGALAMELELRNADTRVVLEGPVSAVNGTSSLTILGIVVSTANVSQYQREDGSPITRDAFFAAITLNGIGVKARGDLGAGNTVTWTELEIED